MAAKRKTASKQQIALAKKTDRQVLGRAEWLAAARKVLIAEGIEGVKVDRLAKALKVTRGGFYWRFADLQDLLDDLIEDWRVTHGLVMVAPLVGPGTPNEQFHAFVRTLIDEVDYRPAYDIAVRAWGRSDPAVDAIVKSVDRQRIGVLTTWFRSIGYSAEDADVRAQIVYFHQIGYYAMDWKVSKAERYRRSEKYIEALTGLSELGVEVARRRSA